MIKMLRKKLRKRPYLALFSPAAFRFDPCKPLIYKEIYGGEGGIRTLDHSL